jgi:hypothetical protein
MALLIIVVLLLVIAALVVEVLRLRAQVYDLEWTQKKVFPLMLQAAQEDPEDREYLDPESLKAWTRGEISIDEIAVLPKERPASQA